VGEFGARRERWLTPTATPLVDPGMRAHTFCSCGPQHLVPHGRNALRGGAFAWYQREVARELAKNKNASLRLNEEAAAIAPGAEGLTFLPYLQGERTPHRDASCARRLRRSQLGAHGART